MSGPVFDKDLTGLLVVDPYNDFISEGGILWPLIKEIAETVNCVPNMLAILHAARAAGIRVFYAPHHRDMGGADEINGWKYIAPIQAFGHNRGIFEAGTWGGTFRDDFTPLPGEVVETSRVVQAGATDADAPEGAVSKADALTAASLAAAQIGERLPQKTVTCQVPTERLTIDGLLSDVGWQEAVEVPLSTSAVPLAGNAPHAFVMFAHDAQFLYFAASIPRVPGMPKDGPMTLGRTHDMDLSAYDRIALFLDVDRDGTTWYEIDVDQRGCIAESCWNDASWNPPIAVRAEGDWGLEQYQDANNEFRQAVEQ